MQIPLLHQQILIHTEKLRDLHRNLMMHSSTIPAAEMESMLQEIRNLYNLVLQLSNENALQLLNDIQLAAEQIKPQAPKQQEQIPVAMNDAVVKNEEIKKPVEGQVAMNGASTINEEVKKPVEEKIVPLVINPTVKTNEITAEKKRIVSDVHEKYHDSPTLGNRFADHQTLAEKIAGNEGMRRVSDNLKSPVKDIKSAIGLNEKFQFINHLFHGDSIKYNSIIDELNSSTTAEAAMKTILEVSESNNWESHAASAKTFIDIIERRFSA